MSMETVTSADGCAIALERSGRGPALIIVNGAFGTRTAGAPVATALDADFTVYRYDRRGRGDSGDTAAYAVEREVEDLAAVARAAGGDPYVYGHSSGGALALEAAAAGVGMRGLVVHEPPYVPGPGTSVQTAGELAELAATGRGEEAAERFLRNTGAPPAMVEQTMAWEGWPGMVALAHTLAYDVRICNDGVVPAQRLGGVSCAALATAGELSPPWAPAAVEAVAAAIPDGEWRLLAGQAHNLATDILAPLLIDRFLT